MSTREPEEVDLDVEFDMTQVRRSAVLLKSFLSRLLPEFLEMDGVERRAWLRASPTLREVVRLKPFFDEINEGRGL